jgi:hypothetical protein
LELNFLEFVLQETLEEGAKGLDNQSIVKSTTFAGFHNGQGTLASDFHDDIVGQGGQQRQEVGGEEVGTAPMDHFRKVSNSRGAHFGFRIRQ